MSANPFDDDNATFVVLANDENQHSLWPTFADTPSGWRVVFGEASRADCLEYVEQNWSDIRPKSLIEALAGSSRRRATSASRYTVAAQTIRGVFPRRRRSVVVT